jgi:Cof subfamily protein (haloacid dehalogenase superfamily)
MPARVGLLVTDLDGTLLRSDGMISEYTAAVLNAAIDRGFAITYATARSYHSAKPVLADVRFCLPAVVFNGALVVRPSDGKRIAQNLLDRDLAEAVVSQGKDVNLSPLIFGFAGGLEVVLHGSPINAAQYLWLEERSRADDPRLRCVADLSPPEEVIEILFLDTERELKDLAHRLRSRFGSKVAMSLASDVYCPGYYQLGVYHPRATKRDMVRWLSRKLGVPSSSVVVAGDNLNDLPMFEVAGYRLAVANAHPEVVAAADEIVPSNDEDGFAAYIDAALGLGIRSHVRSARSGRSDGSKQG